MIKYAATRAAASFIESNLQTALIARAYEWTRMGWAWLTEWWIRVAVGSKCFEMLPDPWSCGIGTTLYLKSFKEMRSRLGLLLGRGA